MPQIEKKEPGHPDVTDKERGDPRQHIQPIDKVREPRKPQTSEGGPPPGRSTDSPWMGGG